MNRDSHAAIRAAVQAFHDKHELHRRGGEAPLYRVALTGEELGEIAACLTKGAPRAALAEECPDLLILLPGTAVSMDVDLDGAFWAKIDKLRSRRGRMVDRRIRISEFSES